MAYWSLPPTLTHPYLEMLSHLKTLCSSLVKVDLLRSKSPYAETGSKLSISRNKSRCSSKFPSLRSSIANLWDYLNSRPLKFISRRCCNSCQLDMWRGRKVFVNFQKWKTLMLSRIGKSLKYFLLSFRASILKTACFKLPSIVNVIMA